MHKVTTKRAVIMVCLTAALLCAGNAFSLDINDGDSVSKNGDVTSATIIGNGTQNDVMVLVGPSTPGVVQRDNGGTVVSLHDNAIITVYGGSEVRGNANTNMGQYPYNSGPNVIEVNTNSNIEIRAGASVRQDGSTTNGEAINAHGYGNTIVNNGTIYSQNGAAMWFQDVEEASNASQRNTVTNNGTIGTGRGAGYNVFGSSQASGGPGLVFNNFGTVDGSLRFGNGDDSLLFGAGSDIKGNVDGGGGTNDLRLDADAGQQATLAGSVRKFSSITKQGDGSWVIFGDVPSIDGEYYSDGPYVGALSGIDSIVVENGLLTVVGANPDFFGTVEIQDGSTWSGATAGVLPGTLSVQAQGIANATGNIRNYGTLIFDQPVDESFSKTIEGTGRVVKTGLGTLNMTSAAGNTYSGGTSILNGILAVSKNSDLGAPAGSVSFLDQSSTASQATLQLLDDVDFGNRIFFLNPNSAGAANSMGVIDTNGHTGTINGNVEDAVAGVGGSLGKIGEGTLYLNGTNTYTGQTNVFGGILSVNGLTNGSTEANIYAGTMRILGTFGNADTITTVHGGILQIGDGSTSGAINGNIVNEAAVIFNRSDGVTYSGVISGAGDLTKKGDGLLTLSGSNSYIGATHLTAGTLALAANGSIAASSGLIMANDTTFSIGNAPDAELHIAALTVSGPNASIDDGLNGKTLVLDDSTLTFDITSATNFGTMLHANGTIDATAITVALTGTPSLQKDETVILVESVKTGSGFTNQLNYRLGRYSYDITKDVDDIILTSNGFYSFRETSEDILNPAGRNNINIMNGSDHVDRLFGVGSLADEIAEAYDLATINRAPRDTAVMLQQLYGGYAAYANSALLADANRFRRRWQGQNSFFFDTRLFADVWAGQADAGIDSVDAFASPRCGARDYAPAGQSRIWAGGFGTWATQDERSNLPGYKYDSQGAVLGYEYTLGNLNFGVAGAYSRGDLRVNDLRYKNEADVLNLALYGAYVHDSGFYVEGGFGYGHAWNDYVVDYIAAPGAVKTAKYGSDAFTADLELGYIARLPQDINLIPSVGVEYTYLKNGAWTESVNNNTIIANRFNSDHDHGVDIPLGIRVNKMFRFGSDDGFVIPEVRAAYVYSANRSRPSITAGYAGVSGGAKMVGVEPGRSHWRVGAGVSGRINNRVDFRVHYDFEARSGFKGHNLNASVGLSF